MIHVNKRRSVYRCQPGRGIPDLLENVAAAGMNLPDDAIAKLDAIGG